MAKRTIPELRDAICEIASALPEATTLHMRYLMANQLRQIASELKRRSPTRRAPTTSTPFDDVLCAKIKSYAAAHPDASLVAIAVVHGVNPGRVSEALYHAK